MVTVSKFVDKLWKRIDRSEGSENIEGMKWVYGNEKDPFFYAHQLAKELNFNLNTIPSIGRRRCDCEIVFNHEEGG